MLCPNEEARRFSRELAPQADGTVDLYEMYDGTFLDGDMCNFKISNPVEADFNDVMYIRLEHIVRARAILVKGASLMNPVAIYTLSPG